MAKNKISANFSRDGNLLWLSSIFYQLSKGGNMNISLHELENISELAADDVAPPLSSTKYAQRIDSQVFKEDCDVNVLHEVQ
ncbi:hypothetical protein [Bartonella harrusi]|uniref:Uncharacterized protein n=1 Tax=Bartonella harrusi TaxID=2961895 RepID=A0ABY5EXA6_9HYPH|nr:hypothetical protein [Bartonella harrusi]UTO28916.1 hypothetical protein NMK50_02670 [Bartonella harrusi]